MVFTMDKKEKEKRAREEPREIANPTREEDGEGEGWKGWQEKGERYSSDCATPWRSHGGRLDSYCILGKINWYGDSRGWLGHAARLNRVSEMGMRESGD